ncbi:MAG TPA: cupredoxin family copper-binding protein, partial [Gemmatimonadaceae bacterium]
STLAPNFPNEWELFARWQPLAEDFGSPVTLGGQVGYNNAADGVDGEVSLAKRIGPARLIAAGRALSDPFESGNVRFALAGGATFRLGQYVALAGDVASLLDRDSTERVAWSAGVHIAIPLTPHTLSLHATNAPIATLQDASRGISGVRYGFEFTIPLTLKRYFGKRAESAPDTVVSAALAAPPVDTAATVAKRAETTGPTLPPTAIIDSIQPPSPVVTESPKDSVQNRTPSRTSAPPASKPAAAKPAAPRPVARTQGATRKTTIKNISYLQPKITVAVGTTVEWTNSDPLPHTVTAVDKSFNSGLIQPGKTFRHTFTKAGTFNFYCIPHPFMKGTITVTER